MTSKNLMSLTALLLFLSLSIQGYSQRNSEHTISGTVIDNDLEVPLEYATISIVNTNDPSDINGGVTDVDGKFSIEVAEGTYNILIEFISYEPKRFNNRKIDSDLDLGTIQLGISSSNLDEVVVRAETTQVDVRLDKKIYNIGKDLTTAGGTVSDALNNVPSVTVDIDGGISLRGNENVRILINGKPSAMAGFGDTNVLNQLPADAIERVEVITSPSARYDAEGTAGILNIILRQKETLGFNGSLSLNAGTPENAGISANVNYRTEKFNLFTTTGFRYFDAPGGGFFDTRYNENSGVEFDRIVEDRDMDRLNRNFNTNVGMEYFLTEKSSITGSVFYRYGEDEDLTTNVTDNYINSTQVLGTTREEKQTENDDSWQFSLNYINNFDDKGHKLTADFQFETDKETQFTTIGEKEDYNIENRELQLIGEDINTTEDQKEYLIQADYVRPFGEDSQFEAGYRGNFENEITDYRLFQENPETGNLELNENLTNVFDYTENVNALYTQYGSKFGQFSFLLGLRLENTQLKGEIDSELTEAELEEVFGFPIDTDFDNNYLGLFPTVNFIYELAEEENITIGYNRRINRPRGWFINPFPSRSSNNNVFQGNPNLEPAYSNAFDLGYLKRWEKLTLTSSVYYQHETESFERIEENIEGTNVIRTIPVNLANNKRTGAELGLLYNPARWLRLNGSFNFFKFETEGEFNGKDYGAENTSWFARFSSKVTLPAKIDWQTNAFYRGASEGIQGRREGLLSIDLALSKDIFNENATLSVNVRDLLDSRKRESYTSTDTYDRYSEFQWRQGQNFTVSLIYRFNQQKRDQERRRNGGNGDMDEGDFEG
ncbi:MAG: TonB-dependent receptor [Salegentibacter sp.]|uniref:Outer membrane receptor proteins, mostly Fe transport n=1 Tax=Salegentibacter flavus TaxID=287099 RepID=A0A1I5CN41_9FLAO|nr:MULTISPECIES: TonB-dependent receptor [Salegentibacter]MDR9457245.1 TonB-dependent receptor [Salegentibacter sp.]SFN88445.1 Outer membrane receptor proteins, mostly Fe transport [Salegentibacter flavus]